MSRPATLGLCWAAGMALLGLGRDTTEVRDSGAIELGRAVFEGKGNCTVCHSVETDAGDGRGPDLARLGERARERAARSGIEGPGAEARYALRSIIRPGADLIEGYNPMPESWLPSRLGNDDLRNLVAYVTSLGGDGDAEVQLPEGWLDAKREEYRRELDLFSFGDPERGRKLFDDSSTAAGCIKCHGMDGRGKDICPDLTLVNKVQRPGYILESVLDSSAFLVHGYEELMIWDLWGELIVGLPKEENEETITLIVDQEGTTEVVWKEDIDEQRFSELSKMPGNFGQILTAEQVLDIVAYVLRHDQPAPTEVADGGRAVSLSPLRVFDPITPDQERYRMALERGDPVLGARTYAHYCVMCHGADATGTGFNAAHLETKPANHTDDRRMSKTEDELLQRVVTRGGMNTGRSFLMPPWGGTLDERTIWDLVAYLRTLHADVGR